MANSPTTSNEDGMCSIKAEFIVTDHIRTLAVEHLADEDKDACISVQDGRKRVKIEDKGKKKLKGQNKHRSFTYELNKSQQFCRASIDTFPNFTCNLKCGYQHDASVYMSEKLPDIGDSCYVYTLRGHCPAGITCRFGKSHIGEDGTNIIDHEKKKSAKEDPSLQTLNALSHDVQKALWKRTYNFSRAIGAARRADSQIKKEKKQRANNLNNRSIEEISIPETMECDEPNADNTEDIENPVSGNGEFKKTLGAIDNCDEIKLQPKEKKKIDWKGMLYLSPLTTVGNLPFRRICVEYGADITCSEMAMALPLIQGTKEWVLTKRHPSEKLFGVQVCGRQPQIMGKCAQLLQETAEIDFVDINMGCPIDALYQQGCGSGLLTRKNVVKAVVSSMVDVLDIPLTIKTRMGISSNNSIAHEYMPIFSASGVSLATVHGRSREQRYTKNADWQYIEKCAKAASPLPVFGNGDILSYRDYSNFLDEASTVSGVMIGRGALIKPWIFTEIKEKRDIDMSSSERFEILRKYVNYGLDHWGSDTRGVETTRRFLLEWLSFLHRYVPYGLLERPPQRINQRPPFYRGRDDLETLMASSNCQHWVQISEMLLGPVPNGFHFLPKHKANAWK